MGTSDIIVEINKLPVDQRYTALIELAIKKINEEHNKRQLTVAADALYEDYKNDAELTAIVSY